MSLHDVGDIEAAANKIAEDFLRKRSAYLRDHDREELIAYLIDTAWRLSLRYEPNRGWSFSKLFYQIGSRRIADWYRDRAAGLIPDRGRNRNGVTTTRPQLPLSLDAPAVDQPTTDGPSPSLADTLADQASPSDLATDLDSDRLVGWIRDHRDRGQTPPDPFLGRGEDRRAPGAARAA